MSHQIYKIYKLNEEMVMDGIIHLLKHIIGLCGETHPSLIMGGGVFITTLTIYSKQIMFYLKNFFNI